MTNMNELLEGIVENPGLPLSPVSAEGEGIADTPVQLRNCSEMKQSNIYTLESKVARPTD